MNDPFAHLSTEKAWTLDITDWPQTGQNLTKEIHQAVKDSQRVIIRAYPDKIKMTIKQYRDLAGQKDLLHQEWDGQEYFLYRTPHNIMEIEVKDK
jgi:hypothetical protein